MYDCSVRVPLIMWSRNLLGHKRNDSLVQLMDIAPTVLEAAGLQPPAAFEARSLWPVLKGERDEIRTEVYSELARDHIQTGAEYIVMKRDARWKVVYYLGESFGELYDMEQDPGELRNLWSLPEYAGRKDAMVKDLLEWSVRSALASRTPPSAAPQSPMVI
jgi:arylsulfatase